MNSIMKKKVRIVRSLFFLNFKCKNFYSFEESFNTNWPVLTHSARSGGCAFFFFFFLEGWGSNWHVSFDQIWEDQFTLGSLSAAFFHQQREMKGGLFSQPLDLWGCNHMAITPSWRAPFISPSHLWLPAPGFISAATYWWNSAAFVKCTLAYSYGYIYFNLAASFENSVFVLIRSLFTLAFVQKLLIHSEMSEKA